MNARGVVLLEALLALVILSAAAVSSIAYLASALDAQARVREREMEIIAADRILVATALLSRAELEQRIGVRQVRDFAVWIDRPEPSLFRVGVAPAVRPAAELLSTLVYRPREIGP